jgi:tetratricopeptide (TPR) repeat protein
MTGARWVVVSALLMGLGWAGPAHAQAPSPSTQENRQRAEHHFKSAVKLYNETDFRAALVAFRRAHELSGAPAILYNIAQCQYQLLDYAGAMRSFERYLKDGGASVPPERRAEVQEELLALAERTGRLHLEVSEAGANVTLDGVSVGTTPLPQDLLVSAGSRQVSVTKGGFEPTTLSVDVVGGETARARVSLVPWTSATTEAPAPPQRAFPWIPWAVTAAAGAGAIVTGSLALAASDRLRDTQGTADPNPADLEAQANASRNLALATDILLGTTAVLAGVSLYLTLKAPDQKSPASGGRRPPRFSFVGAGARIVGEF